MKAIIYKTPTCAYCQMVAKYLERRGIDSEMVDISQDHELAYKLQQITGATTVPITKIGKRYIAGWKIAEINKAIEEL